MSSNAVLWSTKVKCNAGDWLSLSKFSPGASCHTPTSRSGSSNGRGSRSTLLTTLKMAVLAPMARPSVSIETAP